MQVYETLDKEVDREVVYQYIQHPMIAKDFAAYLALYNKYKTDYAVEMCIRDRKKSQHFLYQITEKN